MDDTLVPMRGDDAKAMNMASDRIIMMAMLMQGDRAIVAILLAAVRLADSAKIDVSGLHRQIDIHRASLDAAVAIADAAKTAPAPTHGGGTA